MFIRHVLRGLLDKRRQKIYFHAGKDTSHTAISIREFLKGAFENRIFGKAFRKFLASVFPRLNIAGFLPVANAEARIALRIKTLYIYQTIEITYNFRKFKHIKLNFLPEQIIQRCRLCTAVKGDRS